MSRRHGLETALGAASTWNLDELAVYAGELHALGDPRGELIALDRRQPPAAAAIARHTR